MCEENAIKTVNVPSVLYGCCYTADLDSDYITYVDILPNLKKRKGTYLCTDIRCVDFTKYDVILCSPPCNFYSRAAGNRHSTYALSTRELLPFCINEAYKSGKPFLIENVRNRKYMFHLDIPSDVIIIEYGRHTYFTNVLFNLQLAPQRQDFKNHGYVIRYDDLSTLEHQGGYNVNNVFKEFLSFLLPNYFETVYN